MSVVENWLLLQQHDRIVGIRPKMLFLVILVQNIMKYAFHLQVKAVLRGELPPYSNAYVQAVMAVVNLLSTQAANLKYTLFRNRVPLPAATRNALPGTGASIFERTRACHSD